MTRRIALAIMLTSWAVLALGSVASYLAIRAALVDEFDRSLVARASALPDATAVGSGGGGAIPAGDRFLVRDAAGRTIARLPLETNDQAVEIVSRRFATLGGGERVRSLTLRMPGDSGATVVYGGSAAQLDRTLTHVAVTLAIVSGGAGLAAAGVAVGVARRALRPLRGTAQAIGGINEDALDRRIDVDTLPPELRPTVETLNAMLARLEDGFERRRRFLADAAHELRTPVAGLLATLEVSLRRPRDADAYRATLDRCLDDARFLQRLVGTLLEHARGEIGPASGVRLVECDVVEVLGRCVEAVAASAGDVTITRALPQRLEVTTDPDRVRSMAMSLLSNAVAHAGPGRHVELVARREGEGFTFTIADDGPGIAAKHLPHVFEPFYRGDASPIDASGRVEAEPHLGLGLFLVLAHARALGGTCDVSSPPGSGASFVVRLPATRSAGASDAA